MGKTAIVEVMARADTLPGLAHARALLTPGATLAFLAIHPSSPWIAAAFAVFPFFLDALETRNPDDTRQPPPRAHGYAFDLLLGALVVCHLLNVPLAARMIETEGWL
jgi:hypothetical protein